MKRSIVVIISIGVILITLFNVFFAEKLSNHGSPLGKNGVIDLSSWDFEGKGTLKLNGEWEFYPGELILPEDSRTFESFKELKTIVDVPGSWFDYPSDDEVVYNVGTYRLLVQVPKDDSYGLKTNIIRYANRLYMNGDFVGASGVPTDNVEEYKSNSKMYIGRANSHDNQIEIVFHVASHFYHSGGMVSAVDFGSFDKVLLLRDQNRALDALLIFGYLILGLLFLVIFVQGRKDTYQLFFSLFCLFQGVYVSTLNERLLSLIMPGLGIIQLTSIQMILIHSALMFLLLFISTFFKEHANNKALIALCSLLACQVVVNGTPSISEVLLNSDFVFILQLTVVFTLCASYVYIIIVLLRAFLSKMKESEFILVTVTTFICYAFLLILDFLFDVPIGNLPFFLFLVMTVSLATLMGSRYHMTFDQVSQLSKDLLGHDRLKNEFLAKTSHELQSPLQDIQNLSQSLLEGTEGPLRLQQQEEVLHIHNVGKRLSYIVEDLLHASNSKSGGTSILATPINLNVVQEVVEEMNLLLALPEKVKVINKVHQNLPLVYIDEQRLKKIIFNLINNAIRFTEQGEITISAETKGNEMVITVTDTGIGIAEEYLDIIFSSFYQKEDNLKAESNGLGLGLTIAKQLVELSKGTISVSSKVGQGSSFTIRLPLATAEQLVVVKEESVLTLPELFQRKESTPLPLNLPRKVKGNRGYTILVVDDNHVNLTILQDLIQSLQYTVISVDSGQDALAIVEEEEIDLIILDLMMPIMSGYEVCKAVRKNHNMIELPILILTAAGRSTDLAASFQLGANGFLRKPISPENVAARVESLISMKEAAQEALYNELNYFHAQITPHFLYNTLNTIIGLSYKDEEKTREALRHLSTYFRAKLDIYNRDTMISIKKEMELVKSYLAIEQMRYGERLTVRYDIDETVNVDLPSMTIQPLVENAIQHGLSKKYSSGMLIISICKEVEGVKIVIQDDGIGMSEVKQQRLMNAETTGIGFINAMKKLRLIKHTQFSLESKEGKGTKITIIIPRGTFDESSFVR